MWFGKTESKTECIACKAKDEHIQSLKDQIDQLRKERDAERSEYKRAIDALLIQQNVTPIGQGAPELSIQDQMLADPTKYFAYLEKEIDDMKKEDSGV